MDITIATMDDVDALMQYIKNEWKVDHILALSREYLCYEYQEGQFLNFVLAKDRESKIIGMLGFIRAGDIQDGIWTTMWKASKCSSDPLLGIRLLEYLRNHSNSPVMSLGINLKTIPIYKYLGFHTGRLDHYFIKNPLIFDFKIGQFPCGLDYNSSVTISQIYNVLPIDLSNICEKSYFNMQSDHFPRKSFSYFVRKYFNNPIYNYSVFGAFLDGKLRAIMVARICKFNTSSCIRIVDFMGEDQALPSISQVFISLMRRNMYEYIDFYCAGIAKEILLAAGFSDVREFDDRVIVPNYFEPFVKSNVNINYFVERFVPNLRFFKSDGDQDRPSMCI